jgi:putative chitinase
VDYANLRGHIPDTVFDKIPLLIAKYGCTTKLRLAHFLAQCDHESAGFTAVVENLNYSEKGLRTVFGKYFTLAEAIRFAHKPKDIANRVYANRMGNGDPDSGDGFNLRGRGYIQTTGRLNYVAFGKFIGVDLIADPDLVATEYALESAAFFFSKNNLWAVCDKGDTAAVVALVTKRVNGGDNGLAHRIDRFCLYCKYIGN